MSILAQLQALQSEYDRQQKIGKEAVSAYQKLQPQYKERLTAAQQYQPKVSDAYTKFTQSYNAAVGQYNQSLKSRYQTYQQTIAKGESLKSARDAAAQKVNQLYSSYSSAYSTAAQKGQQNYQTALTGLKSGVDAANASYQKYLGLSNQEAAKYNSMSKSVYLSPTTYTGGYQYDVQGFGGNIYTGSNRITFSKLSEDSSTGRQWESYSNLYSATPSLNERSSAFQNRGEGRTYQDSVYNLYTRGKRTYAQYQAAVAEAQRISNLASQTFAQSKAYSDSANKFLGIYQTEVGKYNALAADTGYVTRYAQQQSAGALNAYNQFVQQTYNPAASSYSNFLNSTELQSARQSYETLAADKGYVDRASQSQRAAYESALSEYKNLQAKYQELEPQLGEYTTQMQTAAGRIKQIEAELPGLKKSLAVEQDPRKRETRIGYGRSLLTGGTKRASSAR